MNSFTYHNDHANSLFEPQQIIPLNGLVDETEKIETSTHN